MLDLKHGGTRAACDVRTGAQTACGQRDKILDLPNHGQRGDSLLCPGAIVRIQRVKGDLAQLRGEARPTALDV